MKGAAVAELIVALTVLSLIATVAAYLKAHKLHLAIEEIAPGFNALMRCKWPWRRP